MKITVEFIDNLHEIRSGTVAVVLTDSDPEILRELSQERNAVLIGGPLEREGQLQMVCASESRLWYQSMCFLSEEQKNRFVPGTDVEAIPTPFGKIALCCGEDIFQPMYPRLAALKGCRLLVARLENMEESLLVPGPWSAAQSNCLPIALAVGERGQLILPCAMTEKGDGFGTDGFDTEALQAVYREFPIFDSLNPDFYREYGEVLTKC